MTENENVTSTEEVQNEPVPNPYNMRKSWHTEDVMPKEGISAVIQPGGSIKDQLSIDFCDEHQMAMVVTGIRHFKH